MDTVSVVKEEVAKSTALSENVADHYQVIRRTGSVVSFDPIKITVAMTKAFSAIEGERAAVSERVRERVSVLTQQVVHAVVRRLPMGGTIHIEDIQDQVELALMRAGHYEVCRAYILYRERRHRERPPVMAQKPAIHVVQPDGTRVPLHTDDILRSLQELCGDFSDVVRADLILSDVVHSIYDGVTTDEICKALILSARMRVETDPAYGFVAARLLLNNIWQEVYGAEVPEAQRDALYRTYFTRYIDIGIRACLLDARLGEFDIDRLAHFLCPKRDFQFQYQGLQILYDRYFLHKDERRIELPQIFFMRVAMGLALNEKNKNEYAIEFYNILSTFAFMSSTPTLFNAGTVRPQLSSCFLTTVPDHLEGIYEAIKDNALLSKFAGGLANDWTPVRALGSHIRGTNGKSQGVVPFLKVANDTAVAVNQGGKRKGAMCAYLETWHLDIEEFLELRKNTGDERRRTHDMNTANWIPDLFMKRVINQQDWTLFSPVDVPELHDLYGQAFEACYVACEKRALQGEITLYKKISALQLWRKMLTMLFETGHPWLTFKDACNVRSPQQHVGVVHSSNLCTEITLNTSEDEIAVCNLGSINLLVHLHYDEQGQRCFNQEALKKTVVLAMRMLDNVIDINYYAVDKARTTNLKHRPIGLGQMGFQDCLYEMRIPYASQQAVEISDHSTEAIAYYAYEASCELARERGAYPTFPGSLWSRGILPLDSMALLARERGGYLEYDRRASFDWDTLRNRIQSFGMRNSNCLALAPTATIASIIGVSPSIEPMYQNLFVRSNLSGEFTTVNAYLVRDLKQLGLWDQVMVADLKHFHGSVAKIDRIPLQLRELYRTAFEVDGSWLVRCAAKRIKWLDQTQSLNLYMDQPSGKKLDDLYKQAWLSGLKTTYYLRTLGATHVESSTSLRKNEFNVVAQDGITHREGVCTVSDPECDACQ